MIRAFAQAFGNRDDVILRINGGGKWGKDALYAKLQDLIKKLGVQNIHLTHDALSWKDYVALMSSMDCYVNISRGEGFSISPREALALGIPAIVTDNTAQKTICSSNFVKVVPSPISIPFYCSEAMQQVGYQFNCTQEEVQKALKDVYQNYPIFLGLAHKGRKWVQQYRWANLQKKYLNLVKPKTILFGNRNEVTDDYLMTSSRELYEKYLELHF